MGPPDAIRSRQNPLVQRMRAVRAGREPGWLVLEGERLIGEALREGLEVAALLLVESAPMPAPWEPLSERVRRVAPHVLEAISALKSPPGTAALVRAPRLRSLAEAPTGPGALLVVAADVRDPGNLGALARVAEAAGATGLAVVCGAEPFGDKAVRGSMGSLLRLPVYGIQRVEELVALGWRVVFAATRGGADPRRMDWRGPLALWLPGEVGGEAPAGSTPVTLPMAGRVESLNVATAAAVLLYQAGRVPG